MTPTPLLVLITKKINKKIHNTNTETEWNLVMFNISK